MTHDTDSAFANTKAVWRGALTHTYTSRILAQVTNVSTGSAAKQ